MVAWTTILGVSCDRFPRDVPYTLVTRGIVGVLPPGLRLRNFVEVPSVWSIE